MAQQLMEKGFKNVYILKGGWHEWFRARFPTEFK
ncbi:MAG: rhodanese-like domain-containing protein [Deltaproteobacteria bacterium]|nr:rhodanese-like domain-containing protein [Deltaproteobacteria bacterium]